MKGKINAQNDCIGEVCNISLSTQKQVGYIGQSVWEDRREGKGRQGGEEI
jgi:hypothetical protein